MKTRNELLNDLSAELAKQAPSPNINDFSNGWASAYRYIYLRLSDILAIPDDMVMVPRVPTEAMLDAATNLENEEFNDHCYPTNAKIYAAMIAAIKKEKGE